MMPKTWEDCCPSTRIPTTSLCLAQCSPHIYCILFSGSSSSRLVPGLSVGGNVPGNIATKQSNTPGTF